MNLKNEITGKVLRMPPPNEFGESVVTLNGEFLIRVLFSDADGGTVTLEDGRILAAGLEFATYLVSLLGPE